MSRGRYRELSVWGTAAAQRLGAVARGEGSRNTRALIGAPGLGFKVCGTLRGPPSLASRPPPASSHSQHIVRRGGRRGGATTGPFTSSLIITLLLICQYSTSYRQRQFCQIGPQPQTKPDILDIKDLSGRLGEECVASSLVAGTYSSLPLSSPSL